MASNLQVLENMITEVTSPLATHMDLNAFKTIYESINRDPRGPELALRLLAHKIQSPQEKEALSALVILDLCVQNCGPNFHKELGKFKFLNEIMKVLLPKHLGPVTPPSVREKCITLLFVWQRDYGDKYPKLCEAYQALKTQNVITEDPEIPNEAESDRQYSQRMANRTDIFKSSRHKDKLARLLKSTNPEDLREANAIIKSIVSEEDAKMEKRSRRAMELETLRNNANLLDEMLKCLKPTEKPSASDVDVMEAIASNIKRARPIIFELALTDDDREDGFLADVIETCSRASSILERYEVVVLHKPPSTVDDPGASRYSTTSEKQPQSTEPAGNTEDLLMLSLDNTNTTNGPDLLTHDLLSFGIHNSAPPTQPVATASNKDLLNDLLCRSPPSSEANNETSLDPFGMVPPTALNSNGSSNSTAAAVKDNGVKPYTLPPGSSTPKASVASVFGELDRVGRQMLGLVEPKGRLLQSGDSTGLQETKSLQNPSFSTQGTTISHDIPKAPASSTNPLLPPLASLPALSLASIHPHPHHTAPIRLHPRDANSEPSVEVVLHCTGNQPHPSVVVFVALVTNRCPLPLTNLLLRFGVEKPLKLRQLPVSTANLPAFCAFLPPSPAQQIIYVQRPDDSTVETKMKFQLSFTMDEEDILESGVVTVPLD